MARGFARSDAAERLTLRTWTAAISASEVALLAVMGTCAAATVAFVHLGLRIPGHVILQPPLPLAIGAAQAPRRLSGTLMGVVAAATSGSLLFAHWGHMQTGALVSLALLGPALYLAARGTHGRGLLLARFSVAGLVTNLLAMVAKIAASASGIDSGGGRGFAALWPFSLLSFALCGLVAGLISGAIAIAVARRRDSHSGSP